MLRRSSSSLSGRLQLHCDWRKYKFRVMSNWCWFVFWHWVFVHQGRQWMENSTVTFWGDWGKSSGANIQTMVQCDSWAQNHNNTLAHMLFVVQQFLASTKTTVIPHHPYSPDLAICDFFLFAKMKLNLKGWRFDNTEEIQTKSQNVMKMLTWYDFQQQFQPWKFYWDHCINAEEGYFKEDGGEQKFW